MQQILTNIKKETETNTTVLWDFNIPLISVDRLSRQNVKKETWALNNTLDEKGFLSNQCKEIEENNRMGKTRDLFKKIRYKGTFHAKMGLMKDRNDIDLTEAEDISKRWQEYTEKLYKTIFMTKIITMV